MDENMEAQVPEAEGTPAEIEAESAGTAEPDAAEPERDFAGEVAELTREFPEAGSGGQLPEEVVDAAIREGKSVVEAYREYALAHPAPDRQAPRAPVRGVSGGWPVTGQGRDAFLTGFEAD